MNQELKPGMAATICRLAFCRTTFLALVGVVLGLTGCATANREPLALKVMTYNIRIGGGGGAWPGDPAQFNLEPAAQVIEAQGPDIAGLQEVDQYRQRSAMMNQPALLRERLNMNAVFAEAYTVNTGAEHPEKYGVALLSKHPIQPHTRFPLFKPDYSKSHPNYPDYYSEQRVLMYAPVEVGGRQVHVFVTHLGLTRDQRERQIQQIAEITARYNGPKVLMGDFNAEPDEPAMKLLLSTFTDALDAAGATSEGRKSFPGGLEPKTAIDYIFVSPEFRVMSAKVIRDASLASDHNPVVAELELTRGRVR